MKKGDWLLQIECVITKEVVCENCTEEEAKSNPWDFAIDEREIDQQDWTVKSIHPNK